MKKRIQLEIKYEGTNGIKRIISDGNDIHEALENMYEELDDFENEYINNNIKDGGYTAFTGDVEKLYKQLNDIKEELDELLD